MAASGWARAALCLLCASDLLLLLLLPPLGSCAADSPAGTPGDAAPPPRKKKDIRDYNDADMARLLEQWEVRADGKIGVDVIVSYPDEEETFPCNLPVYFGFSEIKPFDLPKTMKGRKGFVEFNFVAIDFDKQQWNIGEAKLKMQDWPGGKKDDDIEEGDLPEHKRPSAPVDFSQIDPGKPESILKMTKKGKTLMMFVTVSGSPTEKETEEITSLWQGSLFNANYDVQRFIVGSDRAIFMLRDGSYAWEIKDFLISQDRCADVTLEGQVYPGKGGGSKDKNKTKQEKGKKKKEGDPKSRASKEGNRAGNKREDL